MQEFRTAQEAYDNCTIKGMFNDNHVLNSQKVRDLIKNAETNIKTANLVIKSIDKKDPSWMNVYIDYYEALRMYVEALVHLENMKISNHLCLFSYLCVNHPELELDWAFFETVRTNRNGINYYGKQITHADWNAIEAQMKIYISSIKKEVEKTLSKL